MVPSDEFLKFQKTKAQGIIGSRSDITPERVNGKDEFMKHFRLAWQVEEQPFLPARDLGEQTCAQR